MGHFVTGIITKSEFAAQVSEKIRFKEYVKLRQGFAMFPLTDEIIDFVLVAPQEFCFKEFTYLSGELDEILRNASNVSPIVYVETEYFGGEGCQAAIVYCDGKVVFGPKNSSSGIISEALKLVGVNIQMDFQDEFDSFGLSSCRTSEEFIERFGVKSS
jgi:hypothetical protein